MREQFTLLLPVYRNDAPAHLVRAYESSTIEQSRPPAEVVLVQDGPLGPELAEALASLRGGEVPTKLVQLPENVGLGRALGAGLEACTHSIVARMDADDISMPHRFEVQLPHLERGAGLVGSGLLEIGEDERHVLAERIPPIGEEIRRAARWRSPFNHPTVVYRKEAVSAAGGYRHLPLLEDYWLFARMLGAGVEAFNVPEPLVWYRVGAGAYKRRGGMRLLASEVQLQRHLHNEGFTTFSDLVRNLVVRGGYRVVPERVRRQAYRRYMTTETGKADEAGRENAGQT